MEGAHAPLAPSSGARIVACAGSVNLEALYPEDTETEQAREGTAAHWALAEVLNSRAIAAGQVSDAGFVLTQQMIEGAEDVLRRVHALCAEYGEQPRMFVEQRMSAARIHAQCWGTPDLVLWFPIARVLAVLDYKFGHGWVEVFENWQLIAYDVAALDMLGLNGLTEQSVTVRNIIAQPRSYHPDGPIREWALPATDLRPLVNRWAAAAAEALGPSPMVKVNPECQYCRARHACPALQAHGLRSIDRAREAVPFDLPPHALGIELADLRQAIKALQARETGLATQVELILTRGERVPFWGIEQKPGRLAWTVPPEQVLALGAVTGKSLAEPPTPITPTQAKDRGLIDLVVLAAVSGRGSSKQLVMRDDDSARRIFG